MRVFPSIRVLFFILSLGRVPLAVLRNVSLRGLAHVVRLVSDLDRIRILLASDIFRSRNRFTIVAQVMSFSLHLMVAHDATLDFTSLNTSCCVVVDFHEYSKHPAALIKACAALNTLVFSPSLRRRMRQACQQHHIRHLPGFA